MQTTTFAEILEQTAEHYVAEARRNSPKTQALRAVYTLGSVLAELGADDRAHVLAVLRDEILAAPITA